MITLEQKLAVTERIIEAMRWVRSQPDHPEYVTFLAMRSMASDIRGSMAAQRGDALRELVRRLEIAEQSKRSDGYSINALRALAEELIGRWPTVRQALEKYDGEVR